ncbi:c-type cytochrome [Noviherbaspirillum pedocola]|uniref:C-type cytochrome n=1 Tax=Noviherbaspirillum pedocola TaxID=2801341 RepID=A0A934STL4_9BURK|nr:c-type cytochrome [Noviherbaspirillum pedocola]MBK4734973.1 c-type cytochrome [Noviherbaspirillum pedocola]
MKTTLSACLLGAPAVLAFTAGSVHCAETPGHAQPASKAAEPAPSKPASGGKPAAFTPPSADSIPNDEFGKMVKQGEQIFVNTQQNARQYVGNSLNCANCHLDAGRKADASPMWAAYISYPAYRSKNKHVNTFAERLQGCFRFSMNGKAPPLGDTTLVALESYAYWMATGAPVGTKLAGRGYPAVPKPPLPADYARGEKVYAQHCALCHGADGQGQASGSATVFPPLWGPKSFNWGAGMHDIKNAAGFIKANMPLGMGGTLTDQEAWDVATFMDSHERPQDPRFTGSVQETRKKYHDDPTSMYGMTVNGHVLGSK